MLDQKPRGVNLQSSTVSVALDHSKSGNSSQEFPLLPEVPCATTHAARADPPSIRSHSRWQSADGAGPRNSSLLRLFTRLKRPSVAYNLVKRQSADKAKTPGFAVVFRALPQLGGDGRNLQGCD